MYISTATSLLKPLQPAVSQKRSLSLSPLPLDSMRFSGTPAVDFDIKAIVNPIAGSKISSTFLQAVENATQNALMSLPAPLRKEVIGSGFQLLAVYSAQDSLFTWEDLGREDAGSYRLLQAVYDLAEKPLTELAIALGNYPETHPVHTFFRDSNQHPIPLARGAEEMRIYKEETDKDIAFLNKELREQGDKTGPGYNVIRQKVVIPEYIAYTAADVLVHAIRKSQGKPLPLPIGDPLWWKKTLENPEQLTRIIRHEIWHYIDYNLGQRHMGQPFSETFLFQNALKEDLPQIPLSIRPNTGDPSDCGDRMGYYLPLKGRFSSETSWEEAFAEAGSAFTGGGACNPEKIQQLCPATLKMVKHLVLGEPKPRLQPFFVRWVNAAIARWQ